MIKRKVLLTTLVFTISCMILNGTFVVEGSLQQYSFVRKWGSQGAGDGQFDSPRGIAIDAAGNVYVADTDNDRVQKFSNNGGLITQWRTPSSPVGITTGPLNDVYVGGMRSLVQKYNDEGVLAKTWDVDSSKPSATYVAVGPSGTVYVSVNIDNRIQRFTDEGQQIDANSTESPEPGSQFNLPRYLAVDSSENIYVVDSKNNQVQKFDSNGMFLTKWGTLGSADGQFNEPRGIAVDPAGNVFVVDNGNNRVQKFDSNGMFLTKWGTLGSADGQFNDPRGIAVDPAGNVFVVDNGNNRIQVFAAE